MRVSRAQAEENRRTVIEVASRLFRERGFDGIGLNDLMKGAGLTQGGFYKQFESKDDLIAQASSKALESGVANWARVVSKAAGKPLRALLRFYLSDAHRHEKADGCALAALAPEAARRSPALRQAFEAGINSHLDILDGVVPPEPGKEVRDQSIVALSTMVGALVLSRAVDDEQLSNRFLKAAAESLLADEGASQASPLQ
ncbi:MULTISPECIES: TetR/AcrR family transcriptional regulator [unclassified Ensifer]|uniref:TetR/AcrR family transcriptional regulator n=1 Tax=unclassified Ensifer TaxID=2633371 RepID=UPI00070977B0|nr:MULTISPECIES: TetR/AcrR family transcriptional regulator [unclassified Ensifer]KRD49460.1 TetR family transcriptional regulator [Ensifer sp. Root278]MBV7517933.1 TetR/AcrR family transcriptional regulator [Ensifer sp. ENS12]